MPRNFEIPDDMAEFLDEWAAKEQKADAHALLLDLIERYRRSETERPKRVWRKPKALTRLQV